MRAAGLAILALLAGTALAAQDVAIVNARVMTGTGADLERATVLVRAGRIAAVGVDLAVPEGVRTIDATGRVVTPGLLDSYTSLGLVEIGAVTASNDASTGSDRITAAFDVVHSLNPFSTLIPIARTGGITRAVVAPGTGPELISGRGALVVLAGERTGDMVLRRPLAMFASLDQGAAARAGGSRGVAMLRLREILQDARDFDANRRAWEAGGRREYSLSRLDLEALAPVARGELPLALSVNRAPDILAALELGREFGLRLVLLGVAEGWRVAPEINAAGVPVIVDPTTNIPTFDALGATLENAARLHAAGVRVALASFDSHNARNLRHAAGTAVSYGLPPGVALAAITRVPAEIWGIQDRYGTLAPGMDADLVIWSGDPFELLTGAESVFVRGEEMEDVNRQRLLVERYRTLEGEYPPSYRH